MLEIEVEAAVDYTVCRLVGALDTGTAVQLRDSLMWLADCGLRWHARLRATEDRPRL
jgi:hypothetical protein